MSLRAKRLALIGGVVLLAAACGGSGSSPVTISTPTATATPINPEVILRRSGAVMEALESFHFLLTHEAGSTKLIEGLEILEAEGDVINPDRLFAEFTGLLGTFVIKSSLIALEDANYMTNPLTGRWEAVAPDVNPLGFFDPSRGISAMMSLVTQIAVVDPKPGGGVVVIEGALPATALAPLLGAAIPDATVAVELKFDVERFYLLEARVDGRVVPTDPEKVIRVISLSRFNEDIDIESPL